MADSAGKGAFPLRRKEPTDAAAASARGGVPALFQQHLQARRDQQSSSTAAAAAAAAAPANPSPARSQQPAAAAAPPPAAPAAGNDEEAPEEGAVIYETFETVEPQKVAPAQVSSSCVTVSPRQKGNPLLKAIKNVSWEYREIAADYMMGPSICALFLALRYHKLHPDYIYGRVQALARNVKVRVLLVVVDVHDPDQALSELAKMCIVNQLTMMVCTDYTEAGRYIESFKIYENKPSDVLQERVAEDYVSQLTGCLTTVKAVNKSDVVTLLSTFSSLADIMAASTEELQLCPGFGQLKAEQLAAVFEQPFVDPERARPSAFRAD
eukprot:m.111527 g.111527  ORF g.111527 m.111527 type:complete len:324 (+) comp9376_c0_seq1:110-1081(+)